MYLRTLGMRVAFASVLLGAAAGAASADGMAPAASGYRAPTDVWSGLYAGANVGGGWADRDLKRVVDGNGQPVTCSTAPFSTVETSCLTTSRVSGALGGIQFGYNFLITPNVLIGTEGDYQVSDLDGSNRSFGPTGE